MSTILAFSEPSLGPLPIAIGCAGTARVSLAGGTIRERCAHTSARAATTMTLVVAISNVDLRGDTPNSFLANPNAV
jgi:hypothetical protein